MAKAQLEIVLKDSGQRIPETLPAPEERDEATPKPEPTKSPPKDDDDGGGGASAGRAAIFAAEAGKAFMAGAGLKGSAMAGLSAAAGPAGAALAAVAVAAREVKEAFDAISDTIQSEVDRIGHLSGAVSSAQARAEVEALERDIRRANEMSDDFVEFIETKARFDEQMHELWSSIYKILIEIYRLIEPLIELLIPVLELFADSIGDVFEHVRKTSANMDAAYRVISSPMPMGMQFIIEILNSILGNTKEIREQIVEVEDEIADPFTRELMQTAREQITFGDKQIPAPPAGPFDFPGGMGGV